MDHPRLPYARLARPAYQAMTQLNAYLNASSVERGLFELLNYRISQLNGCAYCLDLHGTWLREHGEDPRRLDGLPAWREAPWFTGRERVVSPAAGGGCSISPRARLYLSITQFHD